jgi:hypothetical protein
VAAALVVGEAASGRLLPDGLLQTCHSEGMVRAYQSNWNS